MSRRCDPCRERGGAARARISTSRAPPCTTEAAGAVLVLALCVSHVWVRNLQSRDARSQSEMRDRNTRVLLFFRRFSSSALLDAHFFAFFSPCPLFRLVASIGVALF
eukprot:3702783-Rhodomonas_salina.1